MILINLPAGEKQDGRLSARIERETGEKTAFLRGKDDPALERAEILLTMGLPEELLARCKALRFVFTLSAGVDRLPFGALAARGIRVANVSGLHAPHMSEQILGVMIGFSRRLFFLRDCQHKHEWAKSMRFGTLKGRTLLIIGAGHIGQAAARKAQAFDMHVLGLKHTPMPLPGFDEVSSISRLDEALPLADYVLMLAPLTPETRGLMDAEAFAKMKPGAIYLNYARGPVTDENALIEALESGHLGGAGLDVFETEPLPQNSPLWDMPNVMITPHMGGAIASYYALALEIFLENYRAFRAGGSLPTGVDLGRRY